MKRGVITACALLVLQQYCAGQAPTVSGELRYEHQYQDFLPEGGTLSTSLRRSPELNLNLIGQILSKRILAYSLFTSLSTNYGTSRTVEEVFSTTQLNWNSYNLIVNVLPYSRARLDLAARENLVDVKSAYDVFSSHGRTRQQEQRATFSVDQVSSLPTVTLGYVRTRSWATVGDPSEQLSQQYTFGLSAAGGPTASANLSGTVSDVSERYTGFHERLLTLILNASKQLNDRHRVSLSSDYNRFTDYSNLTGSLGYLGLFGDRLRISSGISGVSYSNAFALGRTGGISEGLSYVVDPHVQLGLNFNGNAGLTRSVRPAGGESTPTTNWESAATLQHNRTFGAASLSNGLSLGYQVQDYLGRHATFSAAVANSGQFPAGPFAVTGDYSFSYSTTRNNERWAVVGNNAGVMLSGFLPERIRSATSARYRDDHYSGDVSEFRNQRNFLLSQQFDGSFFYLIPVTVGAGGSVNWYFATIRGQTHSWHVALSSPSFFLQSLFANYVYTRTFDPYFRRESIEQSASLLYRWRSLSFDARFRYGTVPVRIRDFWFSVARAF